ncbi:hypothetical protein COCOR_03868 [Corallococcus coralloides DSM 2259]|uniref:EcxA zinc-binding domain-containing protein n=1 Tax=Corallococcus coralloides (strain ATCC 25202 / DSM 2259 / NBRC 100086 / M2) TaxID=1144275 RepID=H8MSI5_CORCM|nr:zinc-dependent metalloprotease [Corallococcus coralloides]AFE05484.1 hypothetical protein COCOR_03868 [Corallococcus coralloides DSM 2259]
MFKQRWAPVRGLVAGVCLVSAFGTGCAPASSESPSRASSDAVVLDGPFVAIPRAVTAALGSTPPVTGRVEGESFYLAIRKRDLGERYFLSAWLTNQHPVSVFGTGFESLGTRVVSFRVQNGKLFMLDVDDTKVRSELFVPEVLLDAWPIVTGHPAFERLPHAKDYVLVDPSAGMDRVGGIDSLTGMYTDVFTQELAYAQRFRALPEGVAFEKLFSGHAVDSIAKLYAEWESTALPEAMRVSGTLSLSLRRYREGEGFVAKPVPSVDHYFVGASKLVPNTGGVTERLASRWNVHPGMAPIPWLVTDTILQLQQDPRFQGVDLVAAVKRGVEGWNQAFGFPALSARLAGPGEALGDPGKNFVVVDLEPTATYAVADWIGNPNTGEVQQASVYMGSGWFEAALRLHGPLGAARVAEPSSPATPRLRMTWSDLRPELPCAMVAPSLAETASMDVQTNARKLEDFLTNVVLHEVGHTLGLRHNFKGSFAFPSNSVMDYAYAPEQSARAVPGPYDVAAIRYLYGLASTLPSEPFCTDGDLYVDPDCAQRDTTAAPLELFHGAAYRQQLQLALTTGAALPTSAQLNGVLAYVRAGPDMQHALDLALEGIRAPLTPQQLASSPTYGIRAEAMARRVFQRLYLDEEFLRGTFYADPSADPFVMSDIVGQLRAHVLNLDGVRTPASRRVAVEVLKKLQRYDAYGVLREARTALEVERAGLSGEALLAVEDLSARIHVAVTPYFL